MILENEEHPAGRQHGELDGADDWQPSEPAAVITETQPPAADLDLFDCDECGRKTEDRYFTHRHPHGVCPRCFKNLLYWCNGCGKVHDLETAVFGGARGLGRYCPDCAAKPDSPARQNTTQAAASSADQQAAAA